MDRDAFLQLYIEYIGKRNQLGDEVTDEAILIPRGLEEIVAKKKLIEPKANGKVDLHSLEIKLSTRRWIMLTLHAIGSFTNGYMWISISSVSSIIHDSYKVDYLSIYWSSMIFLLCQGLFSLPVSFLNQKFGLKTTLVLATAFNGLGATLQYVASYETTPNSFLILFCGRIFPSFALTMSFQLPTKLSATWFGDKERVTATSIAVLSDIVGVGMGFLVPTLLLGNNKNKEDIVQGLRTIGLGLSVICVFNFFLAVAFAKDFPPNPPSQSQRTKISQLLQKKTLKPKDPKKRKDFLDYLLILLKCKGYFLLLQAVAIYYGMFCGMTTVLEQMITIKFPDKIPEVGWMGCMASTISILSILIIGLVIDKTKKYQAASIFFFALSLVCTLLFTVTLTRARSVTPTFVIFLIWGQAGASWISVSFEYIAEITYPVPEEITASLSLTFGSLYGFAIIYSLGALMRNLGLEAAGYTITAFYGVGLILVILARPELKRSDVEKLMTKQFAVNKDAAV